MKKLITCALLLILSAGTLEIFARVYVNRRFRLSPPAPDRAEAFGNFENYAKWAMELGREESQVYGNYLFYVPGNTVELEPNLSLKVKNAEIVSNSLGLRGNEIKVPKPRKNIRIVILGGSTVAGMFNQAWTISHYLEEDLRKIDSRFEVINAGMWGYDSGNELVLLETKILNLQPDLVIVFDGRNDLHFSAFPDASPDSNLRKTLDALTNRTSAKSLVSYLFRFMWRKSVFLSWLQSRASHAPIAEAFDPHMAIPDSGIHRYLHRWMLMNAVLQSDGIAGIFAFQPVLGYGKDHLSPYEQSTMAYIRNVQKTNWFDEVRKKWPQTGKEVEKLPTSGRVEFRDLSQLFKRDEETAYIDSCHYTPHGCRRVADALSDMVRKKINLPNEGK